MAFPCLMAAICWIGVPLAARRMANRLFAEESIAVRWSAAGVITAAFVIGVMTVFGHLMMLWPRLIAGACAFFIAVGWRIGGKPSIQMETIDWPIAATWARCRLREGHGILFCVLAILILQAVMRGLRCPPLSWDSLTYHAFLPSRWVQLGGLAPFAAPGGMDGYRALPWNMELLVAWAILPFKTDLAINLINLPVFAMAALVCYAIARELGTSRMIAFWAPLFFCFSPPMWHLVTTQYNDVLVAVLLGAGVLFLIRWHRTSAAALLIVGAAAMGLACGTKYTALPVTLLAAAWVSIRVLRSRVDRGRGAVALAFAIVAGLACGADRYVENWREFGNPLYPVEVSLAGRTVFDGSPMQSEILKTTPRGERADDLIVVASIFGAHRITWGPTWAMVLPLSLLAVFAHRRQDDPVSRSRLNSTAVVLVILVSASFASYFLPNDGIAERMRRMFVGSSQRMLGFPMMLAACLASAAASRLNWPTGVACIVPTAAVLINAWNGKYPQPPSLAEACVIAGGVLALLWFLSREGAVNRIHRSFQNRLRGAFVAAALFALAVPVVSWIDAKRERSRHDHYAASTDYHEIPRYLAGAWRAVDDPAQPHVVALVERRCHGIERSVMRSALEWFFYPLLGARHQNRVVYASVHEPRDLPSRPFFGGVQRGEKLDQWLFNLRRLGVDRLVVLPDAQPEATWIGERTTIFRPILTEPHVSVYSVDAPALARATQSPGPEMSAALPDSEHVGEP